MVKCELCNREFLADAQADVKWYCDNEYVLADYGGLI